MKAITENKRYSIDGRLALLIMSLMTSNLHEALIIIGQIQEYLAQVNDIEEII